MATDIIAASENSGQSQSSVFVLTDTPKLIHEAPVGSDFYDLVYVYYAGSRRTKLTFDIQNSSSVTMQTGELYPDQVVPILLNPQQSLYLSVDGDQSIYVIVRVERSLPDGATISVNITTNGDSPALSVPGGTTKDLNIHDSGGADVGTRSGDTVTIADADIENSDGSWTDTVVAEGLKVLGDMTLDYPDGTTEALVLVPGDTVVIDPELVIGLAGTESSYTFTTPAWDTSFSVSAQTVSGGGSISNIVIDGGAPVSTFVGASIPASVVVSFDITGAVTSVKLEF